jgi:hypothetical protein
MTKSAYNIKYYSSMHNCYILSPDYFIFYNRCAWYYFIQYCVYPSPPCMSTFSACRRKPEEQENLRLSAEQWLHDSLHMSGQRENWTHHQHRWLRWKTLSLCDAEAHTIYYIYKPNTHCLIPIGCNLKSD